MNVLEMPTAKHTIAVLFMKNENPHITPGEQKSEVQMMDNWDSSDQEL